MIIKQTNEENLACKTLNYFLSRFRSHKIIKNFLIFALLFGLILFSINLLQSAGLIDRIKSHISTRSFKIPLNYLSGMLVEPERIIIDIKYEDYQKLAYNRAIALEREGLLPDYRDEVPALIRYNNESFRVNLRLKGHLGDHWSGDRWSFRISVKGDNTILGMKRFSIQHPGTREGLNEWYFKKFQEYNGLIHQRFDFVDVTINGKRMGIYALEEHFSKRLIENNRMREGPIIHFNDNILWTVSKQCLGYEESYWAADIDVFDSERIKNDPILSHALYKARNLLELLRVGKLSAHKVFDVKKTAKLFAISQLFGSLHPHEFHDVRFYYNPITSLLEPIGTDVGWIEEIDHLVGSAEKSKREKDFATWERRLFEDKIFFKEYVQALEEISNETYLDDFFKKTDKEKKEKLRLLYRSYPWYEFKDESMLYQNQEFIRNALNPVKALKAYSKEADSQKKSYCIELGNIQAMPVEILGILYKESVFFLPEKETIVSGKAKSEPIDYRKISFSIPSHLVLSDIDIVDLKIKFRIPGSSIIQYESIFPWPYSYDNFFVNDFIRQPANIYNFEFLSIDEKTKKIFFKNGEWNLTRSLIVPDGYELIAGEGLKLNLSNSAKILSYSPITFIGSEEYPIYIISVDSTGQGLVVINAGQRSTLKFVNFNNLSNPSQDGWELTGAVTFYESAVDISNCTFVDNRGGDDYLNIIRSDFVIENTSFNNAVADAFDADFAKGEISNSYFAKCGNDAIDVSGSFIEIENIFINEVGDKGISVGENSKMIVRSIEIDNSKVAVASKDMSGLDISNVKISNCNIGLAVYQKKPEFGPASIVATELIMNKVSMPYVVEKGSGLNVEGREIKFEQDNEEILAKVN